MEQRYQNVGQFYIIMTFLVIGFKGGLLWKRQWTF